MDGHSLILAAGSRDSATGWASTDQNHTQPRPSLCSGTAMASGSGGAPGGPADTGKAGDGSQPGARTAV